MSHLRACVKAMDVDMLQTALKEGVFKPVISNFNAPHDSLQPTKIGAETIQTIFAAFDNVVKNAESKGHKGEALRVDVNVASLPATPQFSAFFVDLVTQFAAEAKHFLADLAFSAPEAARRAHLFDGTAAGLMALAGALDQPQSLQALIDACPGALSVGLPASFTGTQFQAEMSGLKGCPGNHNKCLFTPPFFAVHYSADACIDTFAANGWKAYDPIGSWPNPGPEEMGEQGEQDPLKQWKESTGRTGLNLIDVLQADALYCQPATLVKAFSLMKNERGQWRGVDYHALTSAVLDVINIKEAPSYGQISALLATGVMDMEANKIDALVAAAENGSIETVEHFQRYMPWKALSKDGTNLLVDALSASQIHDDEHNLAHFAQFAMKIIEIAKRDGQLEIFDLRVDKNGSIQPLKSIIEMRHAPLLFEFLKNGLDPNGEIEGTGQTLNSMLESTDEEELQHVVHTFAARRHVLSALHDIVNPPGPSGSLLDGEPQAKRHVPMP